LDIKPTGLKNRRFTGFSGSFRFSPIQLHVRSSNQTKPITPPVPGSTGSIGQSDPIFKTLIVSTSPSRHSAAAASIHPLVFFFFLPYAVSLPSTL
jgi:hypothetical protein